VHPYNVSMDVVLKFIGLAETTTVFGLTKTAQDRLLKDTNWVSLVDLVKQKLQVWMAKHPEIYTTTTSKMSESLVGNNGFLKHFTKHPKLNPVVAQKFEAIYNKVDVIHKQQKSAGELRSEAETIAKSLGIDLDLTAKKNVSDNSESAQFFQLCEAYLPFTYLENGYYYGDDNDHNARIVRCLSTIGQGKKMDAVVRIANAMYFAEK